MLQSLHIQIAQADDVVGARAEMRRMATSLGFSSSVVRSLVTVISELARNILQHAGQGELALTELDVNGRVGIEIRASDSGPGIADVTRAVRAGYSTTGGLGLGLSVVSRGMDELRIDSKEGVGTTIVARKWRGDGPLLMGRRASR